MCAYKIYKNLLILILVLLSIFDNQIFALEMNLHTSAEKVDEQSYSANQWKSSEQIYRAFCIYCHQTNIGPAILGRHYSPVVLTILVRNGINTMPTFRKSEISDTELSALAKWVEQSNEKNGSLN
jgi:cytochrome c5